MADGRLHLVIGASGQVGNALMRVLGERRKNHLGTYNEHPPLGGGDASDDADAVLVNYRKLDLSDLIAVEKLVSELNPAFLYLPASYTNVDGCEVDPERSFKINVEAVSVIARTMNGKGKLIYFSSDYIFDGQAGPYSEEDSPSPVSVYGRHKVEAEAVVSAGCEDNLIIRTTVVFGPDLQGKNFVRRLIDTLAGGDEIPVPDDQVGSPTYNPALAATVVNLVEGNHRGVFNVAGEDLGSRYELALAVAFEFNLDDNLIVPVTTDLLDQKAARPLKAGLKVDKVRGIIGQDAQVTGFREALGQLRVLIEAEN